MWLFSGQVVSLSEREYAPKGDKPGGVIRSAYLVSQDGGAPIEATVWKDDDGEKVWSRLAELLTEPVVLRCTVYAGTYRNSGQLRVSVQSVAEVADVPSSLFER